jgi:hypothetical protein
MTGSKSLSSPCAISYSILCKFSTVQCEWNAEFIYHVGFWFIVNKASSNPLPLYVGKDKMPGTNQGHRRGHSR